MSGHISIKSLEELFDRLPSRATISTTMMERVIRTKHSDGSIDQGETLGALLAAVVSLELQVKQDQTRAQTLTTSIMSQPI